MRQLSRSLETSGSQRGYLLQKTQFAHQMELCLVPVA